jgi:hypothetical protein
VFKKKAQIMSRSLLIIAVLLIIVCSSCNNKPKPISNDVTKTTVTVNGKKDSVINNPQKNYGNATVAEPCVKCLIQVVQHTVEYKASIASKSVGEIKYVVNWAEATQPENVTNKRKGTNGLKIDVVEKETPNDNIASFIYDNSSSKLYFIDNGKETDAKIDKRDLKNIRNKCYWGVASSK